MLLLLLVPSGCVFGCFVVLKRDANPNEFYLLSCYD